MKCHLERDWMSNRVKVWLYEHRPDGVEILADGGRSTKIVPQDSERGDPTFTLTEQALTALVRAAADVVPATDATTAHLADAITVRDRLLTLVEHAGPA